MLHARRLECLVPFVVISTAALFISCTGVHSDGSSGSAQDATTDVGNAQAAGAALLQSIQGGTDKTTALAQLAATMAADSSVAETVYDDDADSLWVLYNSGLGYGYVIIDEDEEDQALDAQDALTPPATASRATAPYTPAWPPAATVSKPRHAEQTSGSGFTFEQPSNNKALLINSLTVGQPLQDSTGTIKTMLESRGYTVTRADADLDAFKSLTDYALIYIEAHGWSIPYTTPQEILGSNSTPNCSQTGGTMVLQTTTPLTNDNFKTHVKDVVCGRLRVVDVTVRRSGQEPGRVASYAVTANYIRQHATGNFPRRTLFCLSACRGFNSSGTSEWQDLLNEKCQEGFFMGWTAQTHYALSGRAYLNLFQMMAGSAETFTLTSARSGKTYILLEPYTPPRPAQDYANAWAAINVKTWDTDPITGGHLIWTWPQGGQATVMPSPLVLSPVIWSFVYQEQQAQSLKTKPLMTIKGVPSSTLHIDSTSVDIGSPSNGFYQPSIPVGASGAMHLEYDGRKSPTRDLMVFAPVFTAKGTGGNGLTYTITFRPRARAMAYSSNQREGHLFWSSTTPYFEAAWDPQASVVTWSVTGTASDGNYKYEHSGGSTSNMSPSGSIASNADGTTVDLDVQCDVTLTYTTTTTNLKDNSVSTSSGELTNGFYLTGIQLNSDWTITAGSDTFDSTGTITWNDSTPTPAFSAQTTRR